MSDKKIDPIVIIVMMIIDPIEKIEKMCFQPFYSSLLLFYLQIKKVKHFTLLRLFLTSTDASAYVFYIKQLSRSHKPTGFSNQEAWLSLFVFLFFTWGNRLHGKIIIYLKCVNMMYWRHRQNCWGFLGNLSLTSRCCKLLFLEAWSHSADVKKKKKHAVDVIQ